MTVRDLSGNSPSSSQATPVIEEPKKVQGTIPALAVHEVGSAGDGVTADDDDLLAILEDIHTALTGTLTATLNPVELAASEAHVGQVGGTISNPTANFTRPADTTAYASGDLVANSTTAGSVVAMSFTVARVAAGSVIIPEVYLHKSGTSVTNAQFRLHLFRAAPGTVTNGDNGAFSVSGVADYLGAFDVVMDRAFTDGAGGIGVPVVGSYKAIKLASGTTIVGLLEARAAYTPANAEVFTAELKVLQN